VGRSGDEALPREGYLPCRYTQCGRTPGSTNSATKRGEPGSRSGFRHPHAAGFAPAFPESPLDDEALRPVRQALDTILDGHLPYPAMVVRPHGTLVAANRTFDVFHEGVDPALLAPPVNVFRLALHPDGLARRVRNLPEWGRHITGNLRAKLVRSPDPSLEALLTELEGYLPPTRVECANGRL